MMGFPKGAVCEFFAGPHGLKTAHCRPGNQQVQRRAINVLSKTMLKHATTNVHKMPVDEMFQSFALSSYRHRLTIWITQSPLSHRASNWSTALAQCHLVLTEHVTPGLHAPGGGATSEARKRADWPCHTIKSQSTMLSCTPHCRWRLHKSNCFSAQSSPKMFIHEKDVAKSRKR